jgi:peptidoglycan/LPS O-acetylase OafA/YrhL
LSQLEGLHLATKHFVGVDLLRIAAILAFVAYHPGYTGWAHDHFATRYGLDVAAGLPAWWWGTWWGWVGVQVVFVISGVVIAHTSGGTAPADFARRRFARLLPAMVICATLALLIELWRGQSPTSAVWLYVKSVLFVPIGPWIAGPMWTLSIVIAFYVVVWLMLVFNAFKHIQAMSLALAIASLSYWLALWGGVSDPHGRITQLVLLQHGSYFALGVALWAAWRDGWTAVGAITVACSVVAAWFQIDAACRGEDLGFGLEEWSIVPFAIWLASMVILALTMRFNEKIAALFGSSSKSVQVFALATYPLFLVHTQVAAAAMAIGYRLSQSAGLAVLIGIATSVLVALAITVCVEPRLRVGTLKLVDPVLRLRKPGRKSFQNQ